MRAGTVLRMTRVRHNYILQNWEGVVKYERKFDAVNRGLSGIA